MDHVIFSTEPGTCNTSIKCRLVGTSTFIVVICKISKWDVIQSETSFKNYTVILTVPSLYR